LRPPDEARAYSIKTAIAVLLVLMTAGCGPPREKIQLLRTICTPSNLVVKSGDQKIYLKWDTNCSDSVLISGYYIYLENYPLYDRFYDRLPPSQIVPFNLAPYPGGTEPEDAFETMEITNLPNGVEYYVSVRTVFPDRSLSYSSNEVSVICRPEGEFTLAFRYTDLNDGFSLKTAQPVRADDELNDLFFFNKDGVDYLESPHRLNGFLRKSLFYSLGKTRDIYQYTSFDIDIPPIERMPVREGESYLIKTADGNYAVLRIEKISGTGKERSLNIKYIYQTVEDLIRF
jgi:hypothetical protein